MSIQTHHFVLAEDVLSKILLVFIHGEKTDVDVPQSKAEGLFSVERPRQSLLRLCFAVICRYLLRP
jgi:hypothetical protein